MAVSGFDEGHVSRKHLQHWSCRSFFLRTATSIVVVVVTKLRYMWAEAGVLRMSFTMTMLQVFIIMGGVIRSPLCRACLRRTCHSCRFGLYNPSSLGRPVVSL